MKHFLFYVAVFTATIIASTQLQAAELAFIYSIKAGAESDSNVRLTSRDKSKLQGGVVSPKFSLTRKTPSLDLGINAGADFSRFNKTRFDSNDQNAGVHANYSTAHSSIGVNANFVRSSTRTSELEDSGLFQDAAVRREQGKLGLNWNYTINRTNAIAIGANVAEVDYATDVLRDYKTKSLSLTYTHILNKRFSLQAQAYAQGYKTHGDTSVSADTVGGQIGIVAALSNKLSLSALIGKAETEQDFETLIFGTVSQSSGSFVVNSSLKYIVPRYELSLDYSRSVNPSGNGFVQLANIGRGHAMYRVGKYTQVFVNFTLGKNDTVGDVFSASRDYQSVDTGIRYQFAKAWRVNARYRYRTQEPFLSNNRAKSHAVYFSLHYQPLAHKWKT